jgi:hypothetical protein
MDPRVAAFLEELGAQETIEPLPVRDRIVGLLDQVKEEGDRVALLQAFHAVMGLAVRSLEAQGNDATKLKDAILSDRRFFAIQEATLDGQNIDPTTLHRVVTREVEAGRMEPDSFSDLAQSGAAVLGQSVAPPAKKGFFQRLFGSGAGE